MKSKISAVILADSINEHGNRITTFDLTFPRFILAELATHRVFSMNSASSRAIPFKKMKEMVMSNPFTPIAWQKTHSGMQGKDYFNSKVSKFVLRNLWLLGRSLAVLVAWMLNKVGLTKQLCNRLLEPFMWHSVILTGTDFENFFMLRCPKYDLSEYESHSYRSRKDYIEDYGDPDLTYDEWLLYNKGQSEIHMMELAEKMYDAINESTPKKLKEGEWHLPMGIDIPDKDKLKIVTARCARRSYQTLGDNPKIDYEADIRLHDRLLVERHASPFEHAAICRGDERYANYQGWESYRHTLNL